MFTTFTTPSTGIEFSWASIHADLHVIRIITSDKENPSIRYIWWGLCVVSLLYILLSFSLGEEPRDAIKWIVTHCSKKPKITFRAPKAPFESLPFNKVVSRTSRAPAIPKPRPVSLDLNSGWDDMWETTSTPLRSIFSSRGKTPTTPQRSSSFRSVADTTPTVMDDDAFLASTLTYLGSPTAHSLGLVTPLVPLVPVPRAHSPPRKVASSPTPVKSLATPTTPKPRPISGAESMISSVFDASWPQPPVTPSIVALRRDHSQSPSNESSGSEYSARDSIVTESHEMSCSAVYEGMHGPSRSAKLTRTLPERPTLQNLRNAWDMNKIANCEHVIHVTTVGEAV
ncbi:hypothetical protein AX17_005484 [Amanita inopinata Kibby_2008]|nr:hypothetical protein AX17_005484 [Amanita inopinata Kibby_2008]